MKLASIIPGAIMAASLIIAATSFAADPPKKTAAPPPPPVPLLKTAEAAKTPDAAKPLPDPVARVNGVPISSADLLKDYKALVGSQGGSIPADKVREAQLFILNRLVVGELMYQLAKKMEMPDLNQKLEDFFKKHNDRMKADDEYRKKVQAYNVSEKELKDIMRKEMIINNYIEKTVVSKVNITETDIKAYYDKNPQTFTVPDQVRASHILVKVDPKATPAEKKAARAKIESILKQVKAPGADFGKLAKENSDCPSKENNGDLGLFPKGQMVKPFDDAVWIMKPGDISGIVETQFGYHIIRVTERKASDKVPYSQVRTKIEENLKQQKIREGITALVDSAKKNAKIEIYLK